MRDRQPATMLVPARLGRLTCFPDRDITDIVRRYAYFIPGLHPDISPPVGPFWVRNKDTHNIALCPVGAVAASLTPSRSGGQFDQ
jgi:hypothetical protein